MQEEESLAGSHDQQQCHRPYPLSVTAFTGISDSPSTPEKCHNINDTQDMNGRVWEVEEGRVGMVLGGCGSMSGCGRSRDGVG